MFSLINQSLLINRGIDWHNQLIEQAYVQVIFRAGGEARVDCRPGGDPPVVVQWWRNHTKLQVEGTRSVLGRSTHLSISAEG